MNLKLLKKYVESNNIAENLSEEKLAKIGQRVLEGYQDDLSSMSDWLACVDEALKLSALKKEEKNTPFPNASNIKFPIITTACQQFSARTMPELIKDNKIVKAQVIGKDPDGSKMLRAERVSKFMSYQLLTESKTWKKQLDKLLTTLPNIGFMIKKTYWDPIKKQNCSDVCNYKDVIINSNIESLDEAERITHVLHYFTNDLVEMKQAGLYLKKVVDEEIARYKELEVVKKIDVLEQHRYLDLDDDGYKEPYCVTVLKDNGKVLRIKASFNEEGIITEDQLSSDSYGEQDEDKGDSKKLIKIDPIRYFTDFHFLPSPDGKFHSMGFGTLMHHMNETINTILNQLIDAGRLSNMRGGYLDSRAKIQSGDSLHEPGEFKKVKMNSMLTLKDAFLPIEYREPSQVLLSLLEILITSAKELSSTTDAMQGTQQTQNAKSGAVISQIEQGMKILTSIQVRFYDSLREEFLKLFKLNREYLDPQIERNVLDDVLAVSQIDFDLDKLDVFPVADPNMSSDAQRMARAQVLQSLVGHPGVDIQEIDRRTLEMFDVPAPEKVLPPKDPKAPPPLEVLQFQAETEKNAQELNIKGRIVALDEKRFMLDALKIEAEIMKLKTASIKDLADAEATEVGTQLQDYQTSLGILQTKLDNIMQHKQAQSEQEARMQEQSHAQQQQMQQMQHEREMATQQQSHERQLNQQAPSEESASSPVA